MTETEIPRIVVPRMAWLKDVKGYEQFVADVETTYNLRQIPIRDVKWADIPANQFGTSVLTYPPRVVVAPVRGAPSLSINLHPTRDGKPVTPNNCYGAAMMFREVERLGDSKLRTYEFRKLRGTTEEKSILPQTRSLRGIISQTSKLPDTTPVVHVLALLPQSNDGSYNTEFAPYISFDSGHSHYEVMFAVADSLSVFGALTNGMPREILDVDKDQNTSLWKADFVPDMGDLEKLMLPSSHGHMILIAKPVKDPTKMFDIDKYLSEHGGSWGSRGSNTFGGGEFLMKGGSSKGVTIGAADISAGTKVGKGTLHEGELEDSREGRAVIYHIKTLMVKRDTNLDSEGLGRLVNTMDNYVSLN